MNKHFRNALIGAGVTALPAVCAGWSGVAFVFGMAEIRLTMGRLLLILLSLSAVGAVPGAIGGLIGGTFVDSKWAAGIGAILAGGLSIYLILLS